MLFLGKAWRTGAPKFRIKFDHSAIAAVQGKHAARWRGAIPCKWATAAASCLLMGSRPQWPPFGAKPRSCKYSYGVSPGLSPGSFYPPPRSAAAQGTMIRCILFYVQNTTPGSNCQCLFPSLPLFRDVHPKIRIERNPLRRQAPKGGVGAGLGPHPVERK